MWVLTVLLDVAVWVPTVLLDVAVWVLTVLLDVAVWVLTVLLDVAVWVPSSSGENFSRRGDFSLGVHMSSDSLPPKLIQMKV